MLNARGNLVSGSEDLFPFPVRWLPDGRFVYTSDGKIRIRDAAGASAGEVAFSANLTVRRPVFNKAKDHQFDRMGPQPVTGISAPALSPDGKCVVFVALNDLWVMKIGEAPVRLTNDRDGNPQWTPTARPCTFRASAQMPARLRSTRSTSRARRASGSARLPRSRWSRRRCRRAVTESPTPRASGQLELWNIAAKIAQVVIPQVSRQVSTPNWTADSAKIVLVDNEAINNRFREGYNKLRVIDLAAKTGTFHPLAAAPQQVSARGEGAAACSPDGKQVAFIMDSRLHVMSMNADGSPAGVAKAITTEAADLLSWSDGGGCFPKGLRCLRFERIDRRAQKRKWQASCSPIAAARRARGPSGLAQSRRDRLRAAATA